jgi:uncharacterized membrane protein YphA (DoxX/SURF4 family)
MGTALLIGRLGLACVLAYAGIAKLRDRAGTRGTLVRFGAPGSVAPAAALALPLLELAVAVALVPATTARAAGVVAAVLLTLFTAVIARAVIAGDRAPCNCFGVRPRRGARALGAPALVRNLLLTGVAIAVAVTATPQSIGSAVGGIDATVTVIAGVAVVVVAAQAWFSFELFRQNARLLERVQRLEQERLPAAAPEPAELELRVVR